MVRRAPHPLLLALSAPGALAAPGKDGGEGPWGVTNDRVVTMAGFFIIAGFPVLIRPLDRYDAPGEARPRRWNAEKARRARADIRGGW